MTDPESTSPGAKQDRHTVLVVDDSEVSRSLIQLLLEREGLHVLTAADGAEGSVLALREHPSVVVTDLEMPVMSGYQLARLIKSDPATRDILVLIVTGHNEAPSRFWGRETGADAYVIKDNLRSELVPKVIELLAQAPRIATASTGPSPSSLDVLARVSHQLDARLLEAVLVNKLLERGMQARGLGEAAESVLDVLSQISDAEMLGLVLAEPDLATVFLRPVATFGERARDAVVEHVLSGLGVAREAPRRVVTQGDFQGENPVDPEALEGFDLPLHGAQGLLFVLPATPYAGQTPERQLFEHLRSHLALTLDNARLAQQVRELSLLDGLTRVLNRRAIQDRLTEELERARRYKSALSILLCDLDDFKQVNDTYGHLAGDQVLKAVAELLRQADRKTDIVGRFGGEEFLVVLPNTHLEEAVTAAHRLVGAIATARIAVNDQTTLQISTSLGVASVMELDDDGKVDDLLHLADERLYEAKRLGKNQVQPRP